jgi:hypothetical protein
MTSLEEVMLSRREYLVQGIEIEEIRALIIQIITQSAETRIIIPVFIKQLLHFSKRIINLIQI